MTATSTPRPDAARTAARLRQLVEIESPTGHREGILACLRLVESWVAPLLGRPGELRTVDDVDHLYWPAERGDGDVLLLAHIDTVWPLGTLAGRPYREEDGRAHGPGTFDMKAGLVAAIDALELTDDRSHVALLVTGDEERGSLTSRALIEEAARRSSAVLVLEPSLDGAVKIARRGGSIYRIEAHGRAAHAGLEPERGANALLEIAHLALAVADVADAENGTTVTPTVARAGTTVNTVPAEAELHLDVRAWTVRELERVDAALRRLPATLPGVALELHGGINRPPLERESALRLLDVAQRAARDAGLPELEAAAVGGASDGNFTAALGVPTLDGLGPLGDGAHAPHEWVDLASLTERAALVAGMLRELDQRPEQTP